MTLPDLAALVREAAPEELPGIAGKLAEVQAQLAMRLSMPAAGSGTTTTGGHVSVDEVGRCLSPEELAERLSLPRSKIYHLLRTHRLPAMRIGRYWRVPVVALEDHLKKRLDAEVYTPYARARERP